MPSLKGKTWNDNGLSGIGRDNQLLIKRSKFDVKIILRESSDASKYELFQRLNMGGSQLSDQEIRNVMVIMVDPSFYDWIDSLSKNEHFQSCIALSDRLLSEQYDLELAVRFLTLSRIQDSDFRVIDDLGSFLNTEIIRLAEDDTYDRNREEVTFSATFRVLENTLGSDVFRRFDASKGRHLGGFLISAFEVFAIGMSPDIGLWPKEMADELVPDLVKDIWSDDAFTAKHRKRNAGIIEDPEGDPLRTQETVHMPVRDQHELTDRLDRDIAWRKRETGQPRHYGPAGTATHTSRCASICCLPAVRALGRLHAICSPQLSGNIYPTEG